MKEFTFSIPQNIIAGRGSLGRLPELSKELGGKHAFVISGPHLNKIGVVADCVRTYDEIMYFDMVLGEMIWYICPDKAGISLNFIMQGRKIS